MDGFSRQEGEIISKHACPEECLGVPLKTKEKGGVVRFSKSVNIKITNNMQEWSFHGFGVIR